MFKTEKALDLAKAVTFRTRSIEDGLACEECHRLIAAGDRPDLVRRAVLNPAVR